MLSQILVLHLQPCSIIDSCNLLPDGSHLPSCGVSGSKLAKCDDGVTQTTSGLTVTPRLVNGRYVEGGENGENGENRRLVRMVSGDSGESGENGQKGVVTFDHPRNCKHENVCLLL